VIDLEILRETLVRALVLLHWLGVVVARVAGTTAPRERQPGRRRQPPRVRAVHQHRRPRGQVGAARRGEILGDLEAGAL
jgi:hypothetical protein